MDPATIGLILQGLGTAGSLFLKDDRYKDILKYLDTNRILGDAGSLFSNYVGSPAFAAAKNSILFGTNAGVQRLTSSLGARGLSTSGIGAIAPSLAMSGGAMKQADLLGQVWMNALNNALTLGQSRAGVATQNPPRFDTASLLGGGMDALSKYLLYSSLFKNPNAGWHPPMTWKN